DADGRREWRLQARLALVALKAFNERGFLTADIGARAAVHVDVEIIARAAGVFADQPGVIGLLNGFVEVTRFQHKLAADVDIGSNRAHRETGDKTPLQQAVRIEAHDLPVLAGAGFGFIRIDHQIARTAIGLFGHERPFEAGREARAAATAQAAVLDFLDDGVLPHIEQRFRIVPDTARLRAGELPVVDAIKIGENPIFILQHYASSVFSSNVVGPPSGAELMRSICGPAGGTSPFASLSSSASKFSAFRSS